MLVLHLKLMTLPPRYNVENLIEPLAPDAGTRRVDGGVCLIADEGEATEITIIGQVGSDVLIELLQILVG